MAIKEKLHNCRGMSRVVFLLLCGIAAMFLLFAVEGYLRHLDDEKMTFDKLQVHRALELARIRYLGDGCPSGITYYYDAERGEMVSFDEIGGIVCYGRSNCSSAVCSGNTSGYAFAGFNGDGEVGSET